VQDSPVQGWAAKDVPGCLMCAVAFHRAKAAADRLEPHHWSKILESAEARVELEWKWTD
jgi:hypothetical protein